MAASPTSRTLKLVRDAGYEAQVVEHWVPQTRTRRDLFGIVDIVAINDNGTVGIQATSWSNHASRVHKIKASPLFPRLVAAGWAIWVVSWRRATDAEVRRKAHRAGSWVSRTEVVMPS